MKVTLPENWWLRYLGKPWRAVPTPPDSYNCGELARSVLRDMAGIECPAILVTDAQSRLACTKAMQPEYYSLLPLSEGTAPHSLDVAFLGRRTYLSHCGIAVETREGLRILHCPEASCGVCMDSLYELDVMGFPRVQWFRHKLLFL